MKIYAIAQLQEAQDWRPQIERFITEGQIYVIEESYEYAQLPATVKTMVNLRDQAQNS